MNRYRFFSPFATLTTILIVCVLAAVVVNGCRKTDKLMQPPITGNTNNNVEQRFFNEHRSADAAEAALVGFIKRKNEKQHFVATTVSRIGYPRWDKMIAISQNRNALNRNESGDSVTFSYVPYVNDSQNYVNAAMIIASSATDTSFGYICDWQYKDSSATGVSSRKTALFLMQLDKAVFGERIYQITDKSLFGDSVGFVKIESNFDTLTTTYGRITTYTPLTLTLCWIQFVPPHDGQVVGCWPNDPDCTGWIEELVCADFSEPFGEGIGGEPGGGGSGGSGGSGGGGGSTGGGGGSHGGGGGTGSGAPPSCTPTQANNNCGSGWVVLPILETSPLLNQQLKAWDDSIIIDYTVRPCIDSIINKIRDVDSGTIAKLIMNLSGNLPGFNWEIREQDTAYGDNSTANAITAYENIPFMHSVSYLIKSNIRNATNISMARTIIHESVHAFLYAYFYNASDISSATRDSILGLSYDKILKEFVKHKYNVNDQSYIHNLIVEGFHNDIKDILKQLCPIFNINLNQYDLEEYCSDMAWGGLFQTDLFKSLSLTEKIRITNRLNAELHDTTIYDNGITVEPLGEKACN